MAKLTLSDASTFNTTLLNTINTNNTTLETALENTLSRDGTSPNTMGADLDMNSNHILNLPAPVEETEPLRLKELNDFLEAEETASALLTGADSTVKGRAVGAGSGTVTDLTATQTAEIVGKSTNGLTLSGGSLIVDLDSSTAGEVLIGQQTMRTTTASTGSGAASFSHIELRRTNSADISAPAAVSSGHTLGGIDFEGYSGASYVAGVTIRADVTAATPSATDMEGRLRFLMCPPASVTQTEVMRLDYDTGLSMYGANPVIDNNRVIQLRSGTVASPVSAATGKIQYLTDLGGGANVVVHDGTSNKRLSNRGYQTVSSDADFTLTPLSSPVYTQHTGTLTTHRAITLSTTGAKTGDEFFISRTGSGAAFALTVGTGPLASLRINEWCLVVYNGSAWYLAAKGLVNNEAGTVTTTADGTGTGVISENVSFVTVTSSAATNQATLPSGAAPNVGKILNIWVGANGFELITPASSNATINSVDSDGTNQADIGANTLSRLTLVATNTWILENLSNLGAVNTAIVPDND